MKKLISILLAVAMLAVFTACGTVNKTEVSVLWSGDGVVKVPNSLINAVERAMYIENISYAHYGANGSQETQTQQARAALDKGCAALMVELVDVAAAQQIVDAAKAKSVPVVFFNCNVEKAVCDSYDKCAVVSTDAATLPAVYGKLVGDYVIKNFDKLDRNKDGAISYFPAGEVAETAAKVNEALTAKGKAKLAPNVSEIISDVTSCINAGVQDGKENDMVELILADSDELALEALTALQALDYNTTKLVTHCIPVFAVGADADAVAFTDTSTMKEEDLKVFIFNATNLVDAGKLAGTVVEDYDAIAVGAAELLAKLLKGKKPASNTVLAPYTTYAG